MLHVTCHLPHRGVGAPVVEDFSINQRDGEDGHPVVGTCDSVPIYQNLIVHNCWETS